MNASDAACHQHHGERERVAGARLVQSHQPRGSGRGRDECLERGRRLRGTTMGQNRHLTRRLCHELRHGSTCLAIRSISAKSRAAPGRDGSANQMNVSRFPFGPGSPEAL